MMAPEEIIERLLTMVRGAGQAEVFLRRRHALTLAAKGGRLDELRRVEESGAALRIVREGRLGFAHTSIFTPDALDRTAAQAKAALDLADEEPGLALPPPPDLPWPEVPDPDPDLETISLEAKIERVLGMEAAALAADPRVERVRRAEYSEVESTVWLLNSHGLAHAHRQAYCSASLTVKAAQGSDAEIDSESDFSRRYQDIDPAGLGRGAALRAVGRLGGSQVASARIPAVLENRVVAEILGILAFSFLADQIGKGKSLLIGREGHLVMAPMMTLVDDGLLPAGLATAPMDGEGVPRQTTVLVEEGRLNCFLYDLPRARLAGRSSTGNAGRAGIGAPPTVAPSNLVLRPGRKTLPELLAEMDRGILVTEIMGLHTANPITGDFSVGASGHWIEKGRPAHPVRGLALAGNILGMLERVRAVGGDFRLLGMTGASSLLIEELTVGGR